MFYTLVFLLVTEDEQRVISLVLDAIVFLCTRVYIYFLVFSFLENLSLNGNNELVVRSIGRQ